MLMVSYNIHDAGDVVLPYILLGSQKPQEGGVTMSPKLDVALTWAEAIAGAVLIAVPAIRGIVSKLEAAAKATLISNDEE